MRHMIIQCQECRAERHVATASVWNAKCARCFSDKVKCLDERPDTTIYSVGVDDHDEKNTVLCYGTIEVQRCDRKFDGIVISSRLGENIRIDKDAFEAFVGAIKAVRNLVHSTWDWDVTDPKFGKK